MKFLNWLKEVLFSKFWIKAISFLLAFLIVFILYV